MLLPSKLGYYESLESAGPVVIRDLCDEIRRLRDVGFHLRELVNELETDNERKNNELVRLRLLLRDLDKEGI